MGVIVRGAQSLQRQWNRWRGAFSTFMETLDKRQVPYLSHSKIATVQRCQKCYYSQYILGEKLSSDALTTGTLFHRAAATLYNAISSGRRLTHPAIGKQLRPKHPNPQDRQALKNAIKTLRLNAWHGHDVVAVEEPFFMDLAPGLPPVIGVVDLILKQGDSYTVVDHKTSGRFGDPDPDQLVLYAEHVKRSYGVRSCVGAFDEYRLVPDLATVRKAVFRRTPVSVEASRVPELIRNYRCGWKLITKIHRDGGATPSADCWICNSWQYQSSW